MCEHRLFCFSSRINWKNTDKGNNISIESSLDESSATTISHAHTLRSHVNCRRFQDGMTVSAWVKQENWPQSYAHVGNSREALVIRIYHKNNKKNAWTSWTRPRVPRTRWNISRVFHSTIKSFFDSCILVTLMFYSGWYCKAKLDASHVGKWKVWAHTVLRVPVQIIST